MILFGGFIHFKQVPWWFQFLYTSSFVLLSCINHLFCRDCLALPTVIFRNLSLHQGNREKIRSNLSKLDKDEFLKLPTRPHLGTQTAVQVVSSLRGSISCYPYVCGEG